MKTIEKEIRNALKTHTFSVGTIAVVEPYLYKSPDLSKPTVVIQEINNSSVIERETEKETTSELTYQINVMTRTTKNQSTNEVKTPYQSSVDLSIEICDFLRNTFMLTRTGDYITRPYSSDNTVIERVFRVTGIYDLEHEIIYRR